VDVPNDASIANWLQKYRGTCKEQMTIDAILAESLAAILLDIGFQGRNKLDVYIGSNSFYSIDQLIKFLTNKQQEEIHDDKPNGFNSAEIDLIQTTSAFKI
jgi:calcineurin-like phosphoesterase